MKGKDLLRGLNYIDEDLINEGEEGKFKKSSRGFLIPIVASFALVVSLFSIWSYNQNNLPLSPNNNLPPIVGDKEPDYSKDYSLNFNIAHSQIANRISILGHFWEEISPLQAEKLLPNISKKYKTEGMVNYSHVEGLTSIFNVEASFKVGNNNVGVTIAPEKIVKCYMIGGQPVLSEIEGIEVEAGIFIDDKNGKLGKDYIYYADFKIDDVAYYVEYFGEEDHRDLFTNIVAHLILGGKADLSVLDNPTVPELRDDKLRENEVYNEDDFGLYLPYVPNGYIFNDGRRFINQASNYLFAGWSKGYDDIRIIISRLKDQDKDRIVSEEDTKLFDMSLYPIPWADSMPRDKAHIIENPIFKIEDLTVDVLKIREFIRSEQGDPSGNSVNLRFSVLYDDILLEIHTEGVSSEYLFEELSKLPIS